MIVSLIVDLCHSHIEHPLGPLDLRRDLRQIGDLQRCSVLLDYIHNRNIVESKISIFNFEFVLWEFKSLFNQINVLVLHSNICK